MRTLPRMGGRSAWMAIVFGLALTACAGRGASPRAAEATRASVGDEASSERVMREPRRSTMLSSRSRDVVVIPASPHDNPRFDPRVGTLLRVSPPTHSLPGFR